MQLKSNPLGLGCDKLLVVPVAARIGAFLARYPANLALLPLVPRPKAIRWTRDRGMRTRRYVTPGSDRSWDIT